jgi:hypothetical protein
MKNLQYARVGAVRAKSVYDQQVTFQEHMGGNSENSKGQEHTLINNSLNNISCK